MPSAARWRAGGSRGREERVFGGLGRFGVSGRAGGCVEAGIEVRIFQAVAETPGVLGIRVQKGVLGALSGILTR